MAKRKESNDNFNDNEFRDARKSEVVVAILQKPTSGIILRRGNVEHLIYVDNNSKNPSLKSKSIKI